MVNIVRRAFSRFLISKISGWIAILAAGMLLGTGTFVSKQIFDYKELQRKAAYCEGRISMMDFQRSLADRAVDAVEEDTEDVIEEIEELREQEPAEDGTQGCASQRAPDAILRYHGLPDY
jgi:hypothetical protein